MPETDEYRELFLTALVEGLMKLDMRRLMTLFPNAEAIAERMMTTVPTVFIESPFIGACYTTAGLAAWREVSRQAVFQQYRAVRLLGFKHEGRLVYPACQFGLFGDTLPVVIELLTEASTELGDAEAVFEWLHARTVGQAKTSFEVIEAAQRADLDSPSRLPRSTDLTIITGEEHERCLREAEKSRITEAPPRLP